MHGGPSRRGNVIFRRQPSDSDGGKTCKRYLSDYLHFFQVSCRSPVVEIYPAATFDHELYLVYEVISVVAALNDILTKKSRRVRGAINRGTSGVLVASMRTRCAERNIAMITSGKLIVRRMGMCGEVV